MIVAGETSGDLHGAKVAAALNRLDTGVRMVGVGGDRMEAEGVELLQHVRSLAVLGATEIIRHIPRHYMLLRKLRARMQGGGVSLLVVMDYPGFNLRLARAAHEAGVPVLYYITPQVWAWGSGRLPQMAKVITRAAVILPFEEALLRGHGIDATFVGHPLLDRAMELPSREEARTRLGLQGHSPVLAMFPGSRAQEIRRHLEDFVATGQLLQERVSGLRVVVAGAPGIEIDASVCPFPVIRGESFALLRAADAALCKSGTTTLEAAVADCPHVVAYRTSRLTYELGRRLVKIPWIGLVNVVAGREISREFLQDALQPKALADALEPLLHPESATRRTARADLAAVRGQLGAPGASERVARIALEMAG
jgi:lipid-A-disaccharide synthase